MRPTADRMSVSRSASTDVYDIRQRIHIVRELGEIKRYESGNSIIKVARAAIRFSLLIWKMGYHGILQIFGYVLFLTADASARSLDLQHRPTVSTPRTKNLPKFAGSPSTRGVPVSGVCPRSDASKSSPPSSAGEPCPTSANTDDSPIIDSTSMYSRRARDAPRTVYRGASFLF